MKRVLSCILALVLLISMIPMSSITAYALDSKVEKAIEWAISIANDNTHGYSQANRTGPDYDCSSFVSTAFKKAGFSVSGSLHTGNMLNAFVSAGFTKYNKGAVSLQRGDILLRPKTSSRGGHTELYIGNNQCVAAHSNKDGKTGDSSGQEIDVRSKNYCTFCKNSDYTYILRYEGSSSSNNYTYSFNFNANGGTLGSSGAFSVSYGEQFQVLNTTCTRSGYTWAGWNVKRNNDNKWYVDGQGWCTESQISSNGYIKKAYSNYKTLTLDDSWTSGIQGNCSYTFYAVWVKARENKLKVFLSPYGEGYDHITALNNSTSSGFAQEHIYAWYVLYDGNTGALLNTYTDKNYSVELAIYDPNGELVFNHTYTDSNDANWIGVTPQMSGTYTATATISGDFTGSHSTTYQVSYDAELWASPESVSLNLNGTNSQTIAITPTGGYPGEKNATVNYNGSYVAVSSKWSNGKILVTLNGLKVGSTSVRVDLYENYTVNKNVVATIIIPVTVTANTYTISYNANGGSGAPSSQTKYYGTNITLSSTVPVRSGYTFQGWATSSTATTATYQPGGTFSGNSNTTLYAVWKGNATSLSANSSNSAVISTGGEKKYFTFTPSQNGIYVIYSTGTSDTRVYLYDENGTQVNFNDDGGENRNFRLETVLAGGKKYTYAVEYYNSSTTGTINFKFGLIYSVSYNANGGENAPDSQVKDYGASLTLSSAEPTRSGYDFVGWATSSTATSATYQAGGTYTNNAHITLYAVWKVSDVTPWTECGEYTRYKYYISKGIVIIHSSNTSGMYENFYDFNGNTNIRQTNITASSVANYTFRDCSNLATVNLSFVEKIGIYAFDSCTSLTTLNLSDELKTIGNSAFRDCTSLTDVVLPDGLETIAPLAFCGSGLSNITIPKSVTSIGVGAFDNDVVIYGYINSAAQTYAKQNGNQFVPLDTGSLTANTSINVASILGGGYIQYYTYTPTVSGSYVVYSEGSGDSVVEMYDIYGNELANDDNSGSNNNFRLECKLTAGTKYLFAVKYKSTTATGTINVKLRNIYAITYNANGGSNAPSAQSKEYGLNIALSSSKPTRTGYTFKGWATNSTATTASYQPSATFTSNANTTLYAVWEKEIVLSSIAVNSNPSKTIYYIGDSFNANGLIIKLTYNDGTTENISTGFTTSGFDSESAGTKTITVSYGGKTTAFDVTVKMPTIVLSPQSLTMNIGETNTITATTVPSGYSVTWTSSNTSVVTVSNGTITAKGTGTANITAKFTYNGVIYSAVCTVMVNDDIIARGDINGDGAVDAGDAVLISRYDAGFITLTTAQLEVGDVNGDGTVDAGDAVIISRYDAGLIDAL